MGNGGLGLGGGRKDHGFLYCLFSLPYPYLRLPFAVDDFCLLHVCPSFTSLLLTPIYLNLFCLFHASYLGRVLSWFFFPALGFGNYIGFYGLGSVFVFSVISLLNLLQFSHQVPRLTYSYIHIIVRFYFSIQFPFPWFYCYFLFLLGIGIGLAFL